MHRQECPDLFQKNALRFFGILFFLLNQISLIDYSGAATKEDHHGSLHESLNHPSKITKEETYELKLSYGQSAEVYQTISSLDKAKGDLNQINEILKKKYGTYEEAMGQLTVSFDNIASLIRNTPLDRLYLKVTGEMLVFARVQNPVLPELESNLIRGGIVTTGFNGDLQDTGINTRLGIVAGLASEKRIDAVSTDLIDSRPYRIGNVQLFGLDIDLSKKFEINPLLSLYSNMSVHESYVKTSTPAHSLNSEFKPEKVFHRWKIKNNLMHSSPSIPLVMGVETIIGPQPIPEDLLPRFWDYVHNNYPFPEWGAMTGIGSFTQFNFSKDTQVSTRIGFFGGYLGGSIHSQIGITRFTLASWGIENSAAYQTNGQRIWMSSLQIIF